MTEHARILLVTGPPRVGKTTLVRRACASVGSSASAGFYTEEIRDRGRRVGFRLVPFDGQPEVMAHVSFGGPYCVGRYGVDVSALDRVVERTLIQNDPPRVVVVDEIGKMECFSARFVAAVRNTVRSDRPLLATVAARGGGLIAEVTRANDAALLEVTTDSRDGLVESVAEWLEAKVGGLAAPGSVNRTGLGSSTDG